MDGPGPRFVLSLAGCPLRCVYCHDPDSWRMRDGSWVMSSDALRRLERYTPYLRASGGGFTVSGGEPLLQPAFTRALLAGARHLGLHTAVDTSGALGARAGDDLLELADLVLLDIKAAHPALHRRMTGGPLRPTLTFAERLARLGKPTWVRFVLVPGWTDRPGHVEDLARYVAGLGNVTRVEVVGYHRVGRERYAALGVPDSLEGVPAANLAEVEAARRVFARHGLVVTPGTPTPRGRRRRR